MANNTLKESDLTFSFEEVDEILFKWICSSEKARCALEKNKEYIQNNIIYLNFKLKCQD